MKKKVLTDKEKFEYFNRLFNEIKDVVYIIKANRKT